MKDSLNVARRSGGTWGDGCIPRPGGGGVPPSAFIPWGKPLSFRLFVPEPPSFFARERAYRNPHLIEESEKAIHGDAVKLTRYTDPFSRLVPSSTQGFGSLYNWSTSEFRLAVFRYSFHQSRIGPEPSPVVGQTLEVVHHSLNLHHFRDLHHPPQSSYYMG